MENREKMAFTGQNYRLVIIAIVVVIIGMFLMVGGGSDLPNEFNEEALFSFRRITLAPIVIVGGFAFGVYAILKRPKVEDTTTFNKDKVENNKSIKKQ
ncbi:MAG: DUF3098 domain-containing protein [Rikenellaceae bacterium]